jgi:hypothetical protein
MHKYANFLKFDIEAIFIEPPIKFYPMYDAENGYVARPGK